MEELFIPPISKSRKPKAKSRVKPAFKNVLWKNSCFWKSRLKKQPLWLGFCLLGRKAKAKSPTKRILRFVPSFAMWLTPMHLASPLSLAPILLDFPLGSWRGDRGPDGAHSSGGPNQGHDGSGSSLRGRPRSRWHVPMAEMVAPTWAQAWTVRDGGKPSYPYFFLSFFNFHYRFEISGDEGDFHYQSVKQVVVGV